MKLLSFFLLFLFSSCLPLKKDDPFSTMACQSMQEEDYFIIFLVDARHLDYSDATPFFKSVEKNKGYLGHAWIYLQGKDKEEKKRIIEGGHSGEINNCPPRYFDGIMNLCEYGFENPTLEQRKHPRFEPNPIKYLWTLREDGFFQKGSGGHQPTFAAKVSLTKEQFEDILSFIRPNNYPYQIYGVMGPQCCTFVKEIARRVGLHLESHRQMIISPTIYFRGATIRLWQDPFYSRLLFPTPDILEQSLIHAVKQGQAEDALDWYINNKDITRHLPAGA